MTEKLLKSFQCALEGLGVAWREERNFKIEILCAFLAFGVSFFVGLSSIELIIVIILIGFVLATELLNTALEELCDKYKLEHDPHIKKIKDLAAAAVLVAVISTLVIGLKIFVPHLL